MDQALIEQLLGMTLGGRYELQRVIGGGGMGVVFGASPNIAVKVLHPDFAREQEMLRRFHEEAEAMRGIDHPRVVRILDAGTDRLQASSHGLQVERANPARPAETRSLKPEARIAWIAMEFVNGESLAARINREHWMYRRPLPLELVLHVGIDVADALVAVHARGLVHRDVKPANILIERATGRGKLADFGIAKRVAGFREDEVRLTRPGDFVGTKDYAAPEQIDGDAVSASDVYSLARTLVDALDTSGAAMPDPYETWRGTIGLPAAPRRLRALLADALQRAPEDRPTAEELGAKLRQIQLEIEQGVEAGPPTTFTAAIDSTPPRVLDRGATTRAPRRSDGPAPALALETRVPAAKLRPWDAVDLSPPPRVTPKHRTEWPWRRAAGAAAALLVLAAGIGAWVSGGGGAAPSASPLAEAVALAARPVPAAPPPPQADLRADLAELKRDFARDQRGARDGYLRYDCARLRRLTLDAAAADHPSATDVRSQLGALEVKYGKRCDRLLGGE